MESARPRKIDENQTRRPVKLSHGGVLERHLLAHLPAVSGAREYQDVRLLKIVQIFWLIHGSGRI